MTHIIHTYTHIRTHTFVVFVTQLQCFLFFKTLMNVLMVLTCAMLKLHAQTLQAAIPAPAPLDTQALDSPAMVVIQEVALYYGKNITHEYKRYCECNHGVCMHRY